MDGEPKLVVKSELPQDRVGTRTMFDPSVSRWEIFSRNVIAGFGRALGGTVIYLAFLLIIGSVVGQIIFPLFKPYLDSYMNILNRFGTTNSTTEPSMQIQDRNSNQSTNIDELLTNPKVQDLLQQFAN
jgi:hypothetical protein